MIHGSIYLQKVGDKKVKREFIKALAIIIILFSAVWTLNLQVSRASATLTVPDNYPTITLAVNHASQGDVIFVKSGIYPEDIQINKSLTLEGQDSKNTIIIGNGGPNEPAVLTLAAKGIKVSGFTIESANNSIRSQNALGINIQGDDCTVNDNIFQNNYFGIFCSLQSSTTITNNIITSSIKDGIRFLSGSSNNISDNSIIGNAVSGIALGGFSNIVSGNILQNNLRGIGLGSSYSVVFDNKIVSNPESGIWLSGSNNIITANNLEANKYGVFITTQGAAPRANQVYHNNFENNSFNAFGNSSFFVESWDNGYPSGGNYWSDYQTKYPNLVERDSSGIADTPYVINSNNTDNYPLIKQFDTSNSGKTPSPIHPASVESNSIVASWAFDNIAPDGVMPDSTGNNPAVLASTAGNQSYTPKQVPGKFGQALSFDGLSYAFVPPSPSLQTPQEVTIDAWVNVQQIKNVPYNNILVECLRTTASLPVRTLGIAINGEAPQNSSSPPIAALRGCVMTQNGVLNEIDTTQPVQLNQWIHVVFTRSTTSGMHIYVNGEEQTVQVASGVANPSGPIVTQNELYIGHDSITEINELHISNMVEQQTQPLWMQWWLWVILFLGVGGSLIGFAIYRERKS
ncbi:MAG: NosD domain-containing protein [Candidatus Bathyarchaeia archaeon]|jgi:nitrous oxidase accessory protein